MSKIKTTNEFYCIFVDNNKIQYIQCINNKTPEEIEKGIAQYNKRNNTQKAILLKTPQEIQLAKYIM